MKNECGEGKQIGKARRVIGDILLAFAVIFTVYLCVIMTHRINTVVLKANYVKIFRYERIVCAFLLLFSLDVRFGFFTRMKSVPPRVLGWALRILVVFVVCVLLFFGARITAGSPSGMPRFHGAATQIQTGDLILTNRSQG